MTMISFVFKINDDLEEQQKKLNDLLHQSSCRWTICIQLRATCFFNESSTKRKNTIIISIDMVNMCIVVEFAIEHIVRLTKQNLIDFNQMLILSVRWNSPVVRCLCLHLFVSVSLSLSFSFSLLFSIFHFYFLSSSVELWRNENVINYSNRVGGLENPIWSLSDEQ